VFQPLRSLIAIALVFAALWCAFNVPLGSRTFAQHMDRIGQTPEAEELLDGTRSVVDPVLEQTRSRLLGEYIEAPTTVGLDPPELPRSAGPPPRPRDHGPARPEDDILAGGPDDTWSPRE
jgi:hypothetical protein